MASVIAAGTTSNTALNLSGDTSGVLQLATNGTTTALTIDTSQNVGIGTASPSVPLAVYKASDSAINIQNSTSGVTNVDGLQLLLSGANGYMWNYENGANIFGTNNTERMRIDSSGNVLVGKTTSNDNTAGTLIAPTYIFATRDGFAPLNLRRLTSSGAIAEFYSGTSGSSAGTISVASTGMTYTGTNGITFTATQTASADANTLDDYEEGTWTPTYQPQFGSFTSVTYAGSRYGSYTKIGRMVVLNFDIGTDAISVGTGSGAIRIAGLPFTAGSNTAYGNGLFASEKWSTNNPLGVKVLGSNALIELMYKSSVTGNSAELPVTSAGTGSDSNYARATVVYFV